jgi:hypothetical protein
MTTLRSIAWGVVFLAASQAVNVRAQVDEHVNKLIHVNNRHPHASDDNPGSEESPLRTLERAARLAQDNHQKNISTKVMIYAGTYRESIRLDDNRKPTNASIIFEAKQKGTVVVSGSDIWSDWQRQGNTQVYSRPWPYAWALARNPWTQDKVNLHPIVRRREMIFADGKLLQQVLSMRELASGSFYVSEEQKAVYISLPSGSEMNKTTVEVATRSALLKVHGRRNIVLRGLIFQHDGSPVGDSAVTLSHSSHIVIEDCQFLWNNWTGLTFLASDNITARRNVANFNGGTGVTMWRIKTLRFEDNETSHNNWRGAMGGFYGWAVAGVKSMRVHDGIYRRHKAVGNQTRGLWFDFDNVNVQVEYAFICSNLTDGINIEANEGPITIKNSTVCRNRNGPGIFSSGSERVNLDGNIVYDNGRAQIRIAGESRSASNWETKKQMTLQLGRWQIRNNVIMGKDSKQRLLVLETRGWKHFLGTLTLGSNLWYHPASKNPFKVNATEMGFNQWQTMTGQDRDSIFADPRFVDAENLQFDFLPDSPMRKRQQWPQSSRGGEGAKE